MHGSAWLSLPDNLPQPSSLNLQSTPPLLRSRRSRYDNDFILQSTPPLRSYAAMELGAVEREPTLAAITHTVPQTRAREG